MDATKQRKAEVAARKLEKEEREKEKVAQEAKRVEREKRCCPTPSGALCGRSAMHGSLIAPRCVFCSRDREKKEKTEKAKAGGGAKKPSEEDQLKALEGQLMPKVKKGDELLVRLPFPAL
jgi:hypothetical protein